jgi:hypothetical protein
VQNDSVNSTIMPLQLRDCFGDARTRLKCRRPGGEFEEVGGTKQVRQRRRTIFVEVVKFREATCSM